MESRKLLIHVVYVSRSHRIYLHVCHIHIREWLPTYS